MSKVLKILIFTIIILTIFNKQIISYSSLFFLSKWADREVKVEKLKINYKKKIIIIDNIQIKNPNEFYYNNFFESEKIFIKYDFASLFSNLIIINNLIIEKPKFFLEVIKKPDVELSPFNAQKMYDDNVGAIEKIIKTQPKKIWPKKKKIQIF